MKVLIWGFRTKEEIDAVMQKLIPAQLGYLFYVVSMGEEGAAAQWARWRGAPLLKLGFRVSELEGDKRLEYLARKVDYMVYKRREGDNVGRRLLMMLKGEGKHGTVL